MSILFFWSFRRSRPSQKNIVTNGTETSRARLARAQRSLDGGTCSSIGPGSTGGGAGTQVSVGGLRAFPPASMRSRDDLVPRSLLEGFRLESWRCYLSHGFREGDFD